MKNVCTKWLVTLVVLALVSFSAGCAPAIIGGGAVGAWKVGTDERSIGRIWDDAGIGTKVKAALVEDSRVGGMGIDVDVLDGVVYLHGTVETAAEVDRAVALARAASDVRDVRNNLVVGTKSIGQSIDDKLIGSRVKSRLFGEPGLRSLGIDVDVERGVVTLTGIVESQAQKRRVLALARNASGVRRVVDFVKVKEG